MKVAARHPALTSLSLGILFLSAAFAHSASPLPAEMVQAQRGTIGVVSARFTPKVEYRTPGKGGAEGALSGAGKGLLMGTMGAAGCFLSLGYAVSNCAVGLATPIWVVLGAISQAGNGVPPAEVEAGEAAIKTALADHNLQVALRDRFLEIGRARTGRPLVLAPDPEPTAAAGVVASRSRVSRGIDTVIEVGVQAFRLELSDRSPAGAVGALNPAVPDPGLALILTAQARVVRSLDGTELSTHTARYRGGVRRFADWVANDAQDVREELELAGEYLAAEMVSQLFGGPVYASSARKAL